MIANRSKEAPNPTDKHVGSRIRMRRMMLGMSQTRLADGVSLTFQQIQKYEKGVNRVSASRLQQFAKILKVPVPFFFDGAPAAQLPGSKAMDSVATAGYIDDFLASRDGQNIINAFRRISDRKLRHCVVALVEELAGTSQRQFG